MKPTIEILEKINQNSKRNHNEIFTRLYRYMLRDDIYYIAYKKLYSNNGAATKGINDDTADGFSIQKVENIINELKEESYNPKPARRIYIEKSNKKKRPLGIISFTDKLVQEVLRMILESVYEPIFLDCSHGFRPQKSCHTALKAIKREYCGITWFIEGDIKGCFDNIEHRKLIELINTKIKDTRIIKLIYKFLKAGYLENWVYNKTYSGTPQGSIISPILANIYLHELDKFIIGLKDKFDKPRTSTCTHEYRVINTKVTAIRKKIKNAAIHERKPLLRDLKKIRALQLKTPYTSRTDKIIKYVRYADDCAPRRRSYAA